MSKIVLGFTQAVRQRFYAPFDIRNVHDVSATGSD